MFGLALPRGPSGSTKGTRTSTPSCRVVRIVEIQGESLEVEGMGSQVGQTVLVDNGIHCFVISCDMYLQRRQARLLAGGGSILHIAYVLLYKPRPG